jgi:DNA-binding response OmpR family regulator
VLVIDDQAEARKMLGHMLNAEGFEVVTAEDAVAGLRAAYETHPDAILLDVMMPHVDGYDACRRLREVTDVPIIFLTALSGIDDVVQGFSVGADDYVVKPFARSELMSRLRTCLKRASASGERKGDLLFSGTEVMLDCTRHEAVIGDSAVYLTPKEFELLRLLMRHAGKVLGTDAILAQVWGPERLGERNLVKQFIYRLRKKLEPDPSSPRYIFTDRGWGYYFSDDSGR